jgi:inosine/xanthosine triphosphatase
VTILVGSTRPAKVDGVRDALVVIARVDPRFSSVRLHVHDLTAVAPRMPKSLDEIVDGARLRAQALLALRDPSALPAYVVGVEGGVHRVTAAGEWMLQTWAAVTDGNRWGYGSGPALALPSTVATRIAAGEELGDVVDELAASPVRGTRGAWGVLTLDLIDRRTAFCLAATAAFAPFYNAAAWVPAHE